MMRLDPSEGLRYGRRRPMHVLVVDDQPAVRTGLELLFDLHDIPCLLASGPEEAVAQVRSADVGAVVQDMNFTRDTTSGDEGVSLFRSLRALDPDLPIILLTAWTSLETAVQLVKEGAHDYVGKPWDDEKLVLSVRAALRLRAAEQEALRFRAESRRAREALAERFDLAGLVYRSREMQDLLSLATRVAASDAPVLITGPNGAGKERIADIVQRNSRRKGRPFVCVDLGALPEELLEAELFGVEPGAFTGAAKARVGRFEEADGGTLFLDELGNLSPTGQMKLLRVLQTGQFQRLGSNQTRTVDVRVISATNAELAAEVEAGNFREDLYFRLNVIELRLPPLAERRGDVLALAEHFLAVFSEGQPLEFSPGALEALEAHHWSGNVRELENRVRRASLLGGRVLEARDLGLEAEVVATEPAVRNEVEAAPRAEGNALEVAERAAVERALAEANGVISKAAAELGISRQALYRRMERLQIILERKVRGGR